MKQIIRTVGPAALGAVALAALLVIALQRRNTGLQEELKREAPGAAERQATARSFTRIGAEEKAAADAEERRAAAKYQSTADGQTLMRLEAADRAALKADGAKPLER